MNYIRVKRLNKNRAEKASEKCVRVYIDTQADVNIVGVHALPYAEMLERKVNLLGFNGKISAHQQCKLTLIRDDKIITIVGYANSQQGSKTLINPLRINDDTKQITIDSHTIPYSRIVTDGKVDRFFSAFPKLAGERRPMFERLAEKFGCPVPLNEQEMVQVLLFCHLTLGCPRLNVFYNTLMALGIQCPRRLMVAAISRCTVCAAFVRARGPLVTRSADQIANTNGDEIDGLILDEEDDDEESAQQQTARPPLQPVLVNRPPTRKEVEELLREVDNVQEDSMQTLHLDYAHMQKSKSGNQVFLLGIMLPLGRVFLFPMKGPIRAQEKVEPIAKKWNVSQVVSDRAEALNISQGLKVAHRRIPIGRKNANGFAEGYISVARRMLKLMVFKLKQLIPTYDWDNNWETPIKMVEQLWNARASYNRMTIAAPIDYRVLPLRLVYLDSVLFIVLYQMEHGDVMIMNKNTLEMKSVARTQISHIPRMVNALTTVRAKKLSMKDPRVQAKYMQEIETLHKWNCFKNELPLEGDVVLSLIIIPTEVDGKVKTRIGIRGDMDQREVEVETELPSMEIRLLALIKILTDRKNGSSVISLDVPKAYYQTDLPPESRIFIRLPPPYGVKRIVKVIPGLKEGARL